MGVINKDGMTFIHELGRRLSNMTGDRRETEFLLQRLSIANQRYNAVAIRDSFDLCTPDTISACTRRVDNLWSSNDISFTKQDLNAICSALPQTTSCIRNLGCSALNPDVAVLWQGTNDAFSYMCNDNSASDAFFSDLCFKTYSSTSRAIDLCSSVFISGSGLYTNDTICPALDSYLKCVENAVSSCTDQGKKFFVTFQYKLLKPTASILNCNLYEPALLSTAPKQAASILLLVVMLVYSLRG